MLLVIVGQQLADTPIVNLPRDLGVDLPTVGYQRLGWAYDYGGASWLVHGVRRVLELPVHHYVELDFQGFAAAVDALGGLEIHLDHAVHDARAGLDLDAGTQTLDGVAALSLVRTRRGTAHSQLSSADGRIVRDSQLAWLVEAVQAKLSHGVRPLAMVRALLTLERHVVVDESLARAGLATVLPMVRDKPLRLTHLPVRDLASRAELTSLFPPYLRSGASYLELDQPTAPEVIAVLRSLLLGD